MPKSTPKTTGKTTGKTAGKATPKSGSKSAGKRAGAKPVASKIKKSALKLVPASVLATPRLAAPANGAAVLDRLHATIEQRRSADPALSHSARLLSRGRAKVAQKFGEEAVECLIEAVAGNTPALIAESADVLYHLLVMWVDAGVTPNDVWEELERRQGVSGIAEKAARVQKMAMAFGLRTTKIP